MNKKFLILGIVFSTLIMITSCVKDLNVTPIDPSTIMAGNVSNNPVYLAEALGKVYASFIINGQGSAAAGNPDISASDNDFFTTGRALWNLQELPTDEAICAWGDVGIADMNTQTWSPTNPFLTALYQRLSLSVTYANNLIGMTNGNSNATIARYNAEARFLRALAYYWAMDLFGNPPFTTEADGVGKYFPKQIARADLFKYIESELLDVQTKLGAPGFSYPAADQACAWMLLARMYLNAKVYTGTARWADCKTYCDKVINSGVYSLNPNFRHNFTADNDFRANKEMIFSWALDGVNTQGSVGSTFVIQSCSDGNYIDAKLLGLPGNPNWNGNRGKRQFAEMLLDTMTTGNTIASYDKNFSTCSDTRVANLIMQKKSFDIPSPSSSGDYGIGVRKFTNLNADGTQAADYNPTFASTDFPVFRLSEAYLMRAEADYNGASGGSAEAVSDINKVRERAFQETTGGAHDITTAELDAQKTSDGNSLYFLWERGRELYYESLRRTDLIRLGQFAKGTYLWQWKGGVYTGANIGTDGHLDLYPIPAAEVSANPNIKQNPGY